MDGIALVVGELTAYLTANKDGWSRDLRGARADLQALARDVDRQVDNVDTRSGRVVTTVSRAFQQVARDADKQGREAGGKLSKGIQQGIIRNSPLIVAGVAGALSAGAPALLAGAGALFAGIGTAAAAQSVVVQRAWRGTFEAISLGARQDAAVLESTLVGAAGRIADGFEQLRPALREAFSEAAPLIDSVVDGVLDLARNAMPGLIDAVREGDAVFEGLQDLMGSVGTGLSEMFSILSTHSGAAGEALAALGDIVGSLLPILGELLGQGAELAAIVLPPVAKVLGVVADAASALGPLLPAIAAGFAAMKIAQSATGWVGGLGDKLKGLPARLATTNIATAGFGLALGALVSTYQDAIDQGQEWAEGLREGGSAAVQARAEMAATTKTLIEGTDSFGNYLRGFAAIGDGSLLSLNETKKALDDMWRSMPPLEQATAKVAEWTATLAQRLRDEGAASEGVEAAKRRLAYWQENAARLAREEAEAVHGSAIAMEDAVTAAENLIGALDTMNGPALNLRDAQRGFQEAIDAANDALAENGQILDDNTEKGRANNEALDQMATSAMEMAEWVYKTTGNYGDFTANLESSRTALYDQARAFGYSEEGARAYVDEVLGIPSEWRTVAEFDTSTAQGEVRGIIDYLKSQEPNAVINLGVISEDAFNILTDMGLRVEALPDGSVEVTMDDANFNATAAAAEGELENLDNQRPTPVLDANGQPLTATVTTGLGSLANLGSQRPTPTLNANGLPLQGVVGVSLERLNFLAGQRPNPTLSATDRATPTVNQVLAAIAAVQSKTVTITTNHVAVYRTVGSPMVASTVATGGGIENGRVMGFDIGGAVRGPGGPTEDAIGAFGPSGLLNFRLSNGEHVFDAFDVRLMGGQGNVYRFRDLLNQRRINVPGLLRTADRQAARGMADGGALGSSIGVTGGPQKVVYDQRKVYAQVDARQLAKAMAEQQHDDEFLSAGMAF